jgi:hypothetical protein
MTDWIWIWAEIESDGGVIIPASHIFKECRLFRITICWIEVSYFCFMVIFWFWVTKKISKSHKCHKQSTVRNNSGEVSQWEREEKPIANCKKKLLQLKLKFVRFFQWPDWNYS